MSGDFKSPVAKYPTINLLKVYRGINITNCLRASITILDSMKIFSITFCTLVTVYCTVLQNREKTLSELCFMLKLFTCRICAVAHFVLKQ